MGRSSPHQMALSEPFSVGLLLKYRYQKTGILVEKHSGSAYPWKLNNAPNPPSPAITPGRAVFAAAGPIRSTSALPASISTPACA